MPRTVFRLRLAPLPLLALVLAACTPSRTETTPMNTTADTPEAAPEPTPRRKLKPAPGRPFRITMTIKDAPGPLASVEGVAQYDVSNDAQCGHHLELVGVTPRITSLEPFELRKVSDNEYQGTIYADLIEDEDYYGNGVCHWEFTSVEIELKATGDQAETRFLPDLTAEQVFAQQSVTTYFLKRFYPRNAKLDNFPDFGQKNREMLAPEISDSDLFTITLSARKEQP
jgi:hypothetical protein